MRNPLKWQLTDCYYLSYKAYNLDRNSLEFKGAPTGPCYLHGAERRSPSKILADYFINGHIDAIKFEAFISELEEYRQSIKISYCTEKLRDKVESYLECRDIVKDKKFKKKWKKNKFNIALKFAISELETAKESLASLTNGTINDLENRPFLEKFFNAYEVYQAVRAEDEQRGLHSELFRALLQAKEFLSWAGQY